MTATIIRAPKNLKGASFSSCARMRLIDNLTNKE